MNLKYGGDDITLLFMALLIHNAFPYSEIDLNLAYDWQLAQELKERFCTVIEVQKKKFFFFFFFFM